MFTFPNVLHVQYMIYTAKINKLIKLIKVGMRPEIKNFSFQHTHNAM